MKQDWTVAVLLVAALAAVGSGVARAQAPPDLTGVWTDYVEPRQPAAGAGGQGALAPDLPFTDEARRKSEAYRALVKGTGDTPGGFCLGPGMPSIILGGATYPMEIVQRPEQITILYELHNDVRRIYFGARNAPEADRLPFRNGYSAGRWEGNTLVVETSHLVEQVDQRYPHSAQARIVERYSLTTGAKGERVLVIDFTMTDPLFYTKPVTGQKKWMAVPNGHILPYDCAEEGWRRRLEELEKGAAARP
jgi:hypothetical protein